MRSGQKQSLAVDGIDGRWLARIWKECEALGRCWLWRRPYLQAAGSRFRLGWMCQSEVRECVRLNRCGLSVGDVVDVGAE